MNLRHTYLIIILFVYAQSARAQAGQPLTTFDVINYDNTITLHDTNDTIAGFSTLRLKLLKTSDTLTFNLVNVNVQARGMQVTSITSGNAFQSLGFSHRNDVLKIAAPVSGVNEITVTIYYKGIPQNGMVIGKNIFGDKTWFGDNWPDRARHWFPSVDHPLDKATYRWTIFAPADFTATANGLLLQEITTANNKKWVFEETHPIPTKVAVIGVAKLQSTCSKPSCTMVCNYYYPQTFSSRADKMQNAASILAFYEQIFGAYPFAKLNNVQSTTMFGGMENAGNIFYDENTINSLQNNDLLLAHEIVHQWFGNTVTEKDFSHLWLSEGFATFFTNYYAEKKYGKDSLQKRLRADYERVKRFLMNTPRPVVDDNANYMELLNANSYQKGGLFLEALRRKIGEPIFIKSVRTFFDQYKYKNANTEDFKNVVEKVSGKKLKPLFDEWLYSTKLPTMDL